MFLYCAIILYDLSISNQHFFLQISEYVNDKIMLMINNKPNKIND